MKVPVHLVVRQLSQANNSLAVSGTQSPGDINLYSVLTMGLSIGTPPEKFTVVMDTGSSAFWIRGENCNQLPNSNEGICNGPRYDSASSSTSEIGDGSIKSPAYADGTRVKCQVHNDIVEIGEIKIRQNICEASDYFTTLAFGDGIVGLAPSDPSSFGAELQQTLFRDEETRLDPPFISFWYNVSDSSALSDESDGIVGFGEADKEYYSGEIIWSNVLSGDGGKYPTKWNIELTSMKIGDQEILNNSIPILVDTGTTMNLVPESIFQSLVTEVGIDNPSQGLNCNELSQFGPVSLFFGKLKLTLRGKQLFRKFANRCYFIFAKATGSTILGATFLQQFYSVFDFGPPKGGIPRIGFAQRANPVPFAGASSRTQSGVDTSEQKSGSGKDGIIALLVLGSVGLIAGVGFVGFHIRAALLEKRNQQPPKLNSSFGNDIEIRHLEEGNVIPENDNNSEAVSISSDPAVSVTTSKEVGIQDILSDNLDNNALGTFHFEEGNATELLENLSSTSDAMSSEKENDSESSKNIKRNRKVSFAANITSDILPNRRDSKIKSILKSTFSSIPTIPTSSRVSVRFSNSSRLSKRVSSLGTGSLKRSISKPPLSTELHDIQEEVE